MLRKWAKQTLCLWRFSREDWPVVSAYGVGKPCPWRRQPGGIQSQPGWNTVTDRVRYSHSLDGTQSWLRWDTVTDWVGYSLSSGVIQSQPDGIQSQPGWDTVPDQVGYSHSPDGVKTKNGKLTQTWVCIELGCRICQWMSHCSFLDTWTYICIYPSIGHIQALSLRLLLNHWSSVLRLLGSWSEQLLMSWLFTLQMATTTLSRF